MTKDKALRLALEALVCLREDFDADQFEWGIADEAITAIKEALAPTSTLCEVQPEQEPVELRTALAETLGGVYVCDRTWSAWGVGTMTQDDFYPAAESDDVLDSLVQAVIAVTPPPPKEQRSCDKRPWVGLTEDEIIAVDMHTLRVRGDGYTYARAIEAKLKEKNNGN